MKLWSLLLILSAFLLGSSQAQGVVPSTCHLFINQCLSQLAEDNYGYDSSIESIWSFMERRTSGCATILKPYLNNPPYLAVSKEKGAALVACLDTI